MKDGKVIWQLRIRWFVVLGLVAILATYAAASLLFVRCDSCGHLCLRHKSVTAPEGSGGLIKDTLIGYATPAEAHFCKQCIDEMPERVLRAAKKPQQRRK